VRFLVTLPAATTRHEIKALTVSLKEQSAQIQKVSAQLTAASPFYGGLEMTKPASRVVANK
jgi:hypothetical protein